MLGAFRSAFATPDLRRKILVTLGILAIYRLGCAIPSPGVSYEAVEAAIEKVQNSDAQNIYSLINLFSGGALLQLSIFALGIMPYITASIIIQLLTVVIPKFEQLKKEGQSGQNTMTQYTRYLTVGLAVLQSTGIVALAVRGGLFPNAPAPLIPDDSIFNLLVIVVTLTAGTAVIMWMGEQITERGIGNGMSLLIFTAIGAQMPYQGVAILNQSGPLVFLVVCVFALALVASVVFIELGQRRIPVQYAKRMVGRRMYGGTSTYLPLKVNQAGVIPVIFASSLLYLPNLLTQLTGGSPDPNWFQTFIATYLSSPSSPAYVALYFLMIIGFTYFYVEITFNPEDRAEEMKKFGGFIPGIRPGRPTAEYLQYVLSRITTVGSIYLGVVVVLPFIFLDLVGAGGASRGTGFLFGGVAVLILVGVGLNTVQQIESQLTQRNYEGFLR